MITPEFWRDRSVFITGHSGFKGGWLSTWLLDLGARVTGYGLTPPTTPSYFIRCGLVDHLATYVADVRDGEALQSALAAAQPRVVFHLAAQSIVRLAYRTPVETISVNVLGTSTLLEAVRHTPSVEAVVVVTSDKCYENRERAEGYRECDPLGGHDPYSASKAAAELVTAAYQRSFFATGGARVATARAGNVIGGGDWAVDRLVPDAMRALAAGEPIRVRNPAAVRPWQHVLEPLGGYLRLAERLTEDGTATGAWNFGPRDADAVTVGVLADLIVGQWEGARWESRPEAEAPWEAALLRLDWSRARAHLGWHPILALKDAVDLTVAWYRTAADTVSAQAMYALSVQQIREYQQRWQTAREP